MKSSNTINFFKLIAVLTMLIDHAGAILFPEYEILRALGRISFITFAFVLVHNYKYFSKDSLMFKKRLFWFALISQVPFIYAFNDYHLNIFFSFLLSIILIELLSGKRYILFVFLLPLSLLVNYSILGVLFMVILYFSNFKKFGNVILLVILAALINYSKIYSLISGITIIMLIYGNFEIQIRALSKYFYYWFYPVHLILLKTLSYFL